MRNSFLAMKVQFGGFFQNFWKIFEEKVKIIYKGYLDVWKLQSGKMIMETECVRFAKIGGFFKKFWKIFCKIYIKVFKI